jgi:hypothetical protein
MSDVAAPFTNEALAVTIERQVRDHSRATGELTAVDAFHSEPYNLKPEEMEGYVRRLGEGEEGSDIHLLKDEETGRQYLYASPFICEAYARTILLAGRNDPCMLIAETVREESRLYPRPTCSLLFQLPPYDLQMEALPAVLGQIGRRDDLRDIRSFKASTDVLYLYSQRHMSLEHARGLAEWVEVEQYENR